MPPLRSWRLRVRPPVSGSSRWSVDSSHQEGNCWSGAFVTSSCSSWWFVSSFSYWDSASLSSWRSSSASRPFGLWRGPSDCGLWISDCRVTGDGLGANSLDVPSFKRQAEVAVPRRLFAALLERIQCLRAVSWHGAFMMARQAPQNGSRRDHPRGCHAPTTRDEAEKPSAYAWAGPFQPARPKKLENRVGAAGEDAGTIAQDGPAA